MPRKVIDPGPFRFADIHGPHRTDNERYHVGRLLRQRGLEPPRCEFALEEIPMIDLIESLLGDAHEGVDYEAWRSQGSAGRRRLLAGVRAKRCGCNQSKRMRHIRLPFRLMPSEKDHFAAAEQHLDAAEAGFEYIDNRALAAGHYALLGIGHAFVQIAEALDRIADDVDEIKRQGRDR